LTTKQTLAVETGVEIQKKEKKPMKARTAMEESTKNRKRTKEKEKLDC